MANVPNTQINPLYNNALPKPTPVSQVVSPITAPSTTNTALIPRDIGTIPRVGTSIIAPNPVDSIQKALPTVVATTTTTPTQVYATNDDMTRARPIIIAIPNLVSDTVKAVTGSPKLGGGGGGGGGASSEEDDKGGDIEEPKKPNYLLLALLGVGAYFLFKKFK